MFATDILNQLTGNIAG